ncbi:F-actin-capping protein subunit alpha [Dacryopinax primogenitus]|uniref:F-actin-capping protein subunit alpha n=1 Tax=Dacryopinax primogenitus (strain DJM 731) TaxID=1858805 RepID=M5FS67_DACPD|nr:F-actin-capping protein subunit alpha [Dacryopinax primogenitus]EJT98643.1 F-actin-capping protein subunit alpha [Dacryopinax primogenitus]
MAYLSSSDKVSLASTFILQSPPGEVNDVLSDLRLVIADDAALEQGITHALEEYNVDQLVGVDVPGEEYKMVLSEKGRLQTEDGVRYLDPRGGNSYVIDHINLTVSDPQPYSIPTSLETLRSGLQKALDGYLTRHFVPQPKPGTADPALGDAACAVFPPLVSSDEEAEQLASKVWTMEIVSSRYKPSNYWSGRWRARWEVEPEKMEVRGDIAVDVHYYEQGNVQLHTKFAPHIPLPSASVTPEQIVQLVIDEEARYHAKLTESFEKMRDGGFRGLRRVLPVTRGKMDWDKVLGYKLGQELAGTRSTPVV